MLLFGANRNLRWPQCPLIGRDILNFFSILYLLHAKSPALLEIFPKASVVTLRNP